MSLRYAERQALVQEPPRSATPCARAAQAPACQCTLSRVCDVELGATGLCSLVPLLGVRHRRTGGDWPGCCLRVRRSQATPQPTSMPVPMVQVRHMRVLVCQRRVLVPMAVSPLRHGVMRVVVMAIVMGMGVLMLQGLMGMRVVV